MNRIPKLERKLVIYETRRLLGAVAGTALYAVGMNLFVVPRDDGDLSGHPYFVDPICGAAAGKF